MTKTLGASTLCLCLSIFAPMVAAQAPAQMPIQGYLTDDVGTPVDSAVSMVLAIYDVEAGGVALYSETQAVVVDEGYFTAYAGDTTPLDLTTFRDNTTLYMSVTIGGEELLPRSQLATVPFAAYAEYAGASAWGTVTGIPADIADGDNDTTYAAGSGLTLAGTTFSADTNTVQARVAGTCPAGQAIRVISASGAVTCQAINTVPTRMLVIGSQSVAANTTDSNVEADCDSLGGGPWFIISGACNPASETMILTNGFPNLAGNAWRCGYRNTSAVPRMAFTYGVCIQ